MANPTLRITPKKYTGETTVLSMRVAKDMLRDIDEIAKRTGRNRNEILSLSLEFALNHAEIISGEQEGA